MSSKLTRGWIFLLMLPCFFSNPQAWATESLRQPQILPDSLKRSVQQVIASKPEDLLVVLKNGLTVFIHRSTESNVVSARVLVKTGAIYEGRFLGAGLSHYLEHVVSGGTTRSFTEAEARERLKRLGGASNAYTSYDRTAYYIDTSASLWKEALDLLLSYVSECVLDPGEVKREKSVIQQEFKLGENNPQRELWKLFTATAYRAHPVGIPIIGYEEVFVQQSREDLLEYYRSKYQPQNMVVSLAGSVDPLQVLEFVVEKSDAFQRTAAPPEALPAEPEQIAPRRAEKEMESARLVSAMIGFPSVPLDHPDLYALDVLAILMGDGRTSRLYRRLKDMENKVLSVGTSSWTPDFVRGQFIVSATLPGENWPGVLEDIRDEIERLKNEPPSMRELEKAKKNVIAQQVFGNESMSARASSLARSYLATGDPYFDDKYVEGIEKVSPEEVREVARKYLDASRMNVAVIKPPAASTSAEKDPPTETTPAAMGAETDGVRVKELSNGLKVLVKADNVLPMVTIQLYGLGGLFMENGDEPGLSAFTADLLTAGTKRRSKQEIAEAVESVGGNLSSGAGNNTYHVTLQVLQQDLDMALDILSDVILDATFPPEEIEKQRQETLLALHRQDENWQAEIMLLFKHEFFPDSSYGHNRLGTEASVKGFTREDLKRFRDRMARPEHSVLAVYGDVRPQEVFERIEKAFGSWEKGSGDKKERTKPATGPRLTESRIVEKMTDKSSAALFVGAEGLSIEDEDRPVLDVLDSLLSGIGYPGGRLHEALRGKADLVYLVHAFPFYGLGTGYFGVITQTTMGNFAEVKEIIMSNLQRLRDEPVPAGEMRDAAEMAVTMHHLSLETLSSQAQSATVNEVLGLGWNYDERYPDLLRTVTAEDVQELANKLFAHTLAVEAIPENPVEAIIPPEQERHTHVDH